MRGVEGFCTENGAKIHASVARGVNFLDFYAVFAAKFVNFKAKTMKNSPFKGREMKNAKISAFNGCFINKNTENSAFWSAL